jgi:hypothetical protein
MDPLCVEPFVDIRGKASGPFAKAFGRRAPLWASAAVDGLTEYLIKNTNPRSSDVYLMCELI